MLLSPQLRTRAEKTFDLPPKKLTGPISPDAATLADAFPSVKRA
jgi:hypothetical protein